MVITLLTDFGLQDTYVGQMKGIIAKMAPSVAVIDLTHHVPPQDILAGSLMLDAAVDAMPDGSIHVAVVDPNVGSNRNAIAVQTDRFMLVGPDNSIFTAVLDRYPMKKAVRLNRSEYHLPVVSPTFHGRDIFAPVAAHLANGVPIDQLGDPMEKIIRIDLPDIEMDASTIHAGILLTDRFGNLITNVRKEVFDKWLGTAANATVQIEIEGKKLTGIRKTFSDVEPKKLVAYFGSSNRLEIAVRNDSAAETLRVAGGETVIIRKE